MVHPYLRRRQGLEPVTYPSPEVEAVLARTLGVPIFQEQVMKLAVVAAGFTPGEADRLRRSMAAWRRKGGLDPFRERLVTGMRERGYPEAFAERIFQQIQGFGEYGFPESHAASFALLVYVSAWLKRHEPAAFTAALLNSQPMGFYAPAQLVQDARRHGVEVRPVDVAASAWDCTLEPPTGPPSVGPFPDAPSSTVRAERSGARERGLSSIARPLLVARSSVARVELSGTRGGGQVEAGVRVKAADGLEVGGGVEAGGEGGGAGAGCAAVPDYAALPPGYGPGCAAAPDYAALPPGYGPAIRLGLRMVKGLCRDGAGRLVAARAAAPFRDVDDLARRARLDRRDLEGLAAAGALEGIAGDRHQARWAALGVAEPAPLFADASLPESRPALPAPTEAEDLLADYAALGLSLGRHPLALLRPQLRRRHLASAAEVGGLAHGERVRTAGLVVNRQRPGTASGVTFVTLEDETGHVNLVVWSRVAERQRRALLASRLLAVAGRVEREGAVVHVVVRRLEDLSGLIGDLRAHSRDFH
jgi:error-prone DNA polymerase